MAKEELSFAVYQLTIRRAYGDASELRALKWFDPYAGFKKALKRSEGLGPVGTRKYLKLSEAFSDDETRYLWGYLTNGDHGLDRPLLEIDEENSTVTEVGKIKRNQSVPTKNFYCVYWPTNGPNGYLMLQQVGNATHVGLMHDVLKQSLDLRTFTFRDPQRIAPLDYLERAKKADLKRVVFTKRVYEGKALLKLEDQLDMKDAGKVTIIIEPHREGSLDSLRGLLQMISSEKKKGIAVADMTELGADTAKFTMELNGKQFSLASADEVLGRPTFVEPIDFDDNGPVEAELLKYAQSVFEAILDLNAE